MSGPNGNDLARRQAASRRRAAGVVEDFDPTRLALARRLKAMPRTKLSASVELSPAAITQFEKGQTRPAYPTLARLALALGVSEEFFRAGAPTPELPARSAHFRSLRATTALERDQSLAFGELVLSVVNAVEQQVDLPPVALPELDLPQSLDETRIDLLAAETRDRMGLGVGPIPNVVRLLEASGVAVVHLEAPSYRVDAFSHQNHEGRPLVLLSEEKQDKARSRFDAAHELGHLLIHHDAEPGSRLIEQQAHRFASAFLAPASEILDDLPSRPDWPALQRLKRRWGVSLKALVFRCYVLGKFSRNDYRRAMQYLSLQGLPEPGSLGEVERPVLLPRAIDLIDPPPDGISRVADLAGLDFAAVERVWIAAGGRARKPAVDM